MLKPVEWTGSSKTDLKCFPDPVQGRMGFGSGVVEQESRHRLHSSNASGTSGPPSYR